MHLCADAEASGADQELQVRCAPHPCWPPQRLLRPRALGPPRGWARGVFCRPDVDAVPHAGGTGKPHAPDCLLSLPLICSLQTWAAVPLLTGFPSALLTSGLGPSLRGVPQVVSRALWGAELHPWPPST